MSDIHITCTKNTGVTMVSNTFIGHFMADANGEYVKVYLYLLYLAGGNGGNGSFSINGACDFLSCTERDIVRALEYWEKANLLTLRRDPSGNIMSLTMSDTGTAVEGGGSLVASYTVPGVPAKESFTRKELAAAEVIASDADLKWLFSISEKLIGRILTSADMNLITDLYEKMNCSKELIVYLYEYCAETEHTDSKYIEKVALNWVDGGVQTVEQAKDASARFNVYYRSVMKSFGLNRLPGEAERRFIDKWSAEYGMNEQLITEACGRALIQTGKPDFKYTDRILSIWAKGNIHTLDQVADADRVHAACTAASKVPATAKPANNRFNAFNQRDYSDDQIAAIERRMQNR